MATIKTSLVLQDKMSAPLKRATKSLASFSASSSKVENLTKSLLRLGAMSTKSLKDISTSSAQLVQAMSNNTDAMIRGFGSLEKKLEFAGDKMNSYNRKTNEAGNAQQKFNNIINGTNFAGLMADLFLVERFLRGLGSIMDKVDEVNSANVRLKLSVGEENFADAQNMIFSAAKRSNSSFKEMVSDVSKLQMLAGNVFDSTEKAVSFSETIGKMFKISGTDTNTQIAASRQLVQALSSGVLRGDELNSVLEGAPMVIQKIAKYMDVPVEKIKELASQGLISSDILLNAILTSYDEINDMFAGIPKTFSGVITAMVTDLTMGLMPLFEKIQSVLNSSMFSSFITNLTNALLVLGSILGGFIDILGFISVAVQENWDIIQSVLIGLMAAITVLKLHAIAAAVAAGMAAVKAAIASIIAMSPIIFLVLGITLVVAGLVMMLKHLGVTTRDVFGFIGSAVFVIKDAFLNVCKLLYNLWIQVQEFSENTSNAIAFAIQDTFYQAGNAILKFFDAVMQGIADMANWLLTQLNSIFGTDFAKIEPTFSKKLLSSFEEKFSPELKADVDYAGKLKEYKSLSESMAEGKETFEGFYDKAGGFFDKLPKMSEDNGLGNLGVGFSGLGVGNNLGNVGKVGSVGKIDESVDISSEDLKHLRDVAEREIINKFTTATAAPNISISFGDIRETADSSQILGIVKNQLEEELMSFSEGVYA